MPRYIIKIAGKYMECSSIVNAIVTCPMALEEFTEFYLEYSPLKPERAREELAERLVRVEERGTSCMLDRSAEDTVQCNRMYEGNDRWHEEDGEKYPDLSLTWAEVVAMVEDDKHPYWGYEEDEKV